MTIDQVGEMQDPNGTPLPEVSPLAWIFIIWHCSGLLRHSALVHHHVRSEPSENADGETEHRD